MKTERKIIEVTIYLKSGASFTIDAYRFSITRNSNNELTAIEWEIPKDIDDMRYRAIGYIRLDDISAIVQK